MEKTEQRGKVNPSKKILTIIFQVTKQRTQERARLLWVPGYSEHEVGAVVGASGNQSEEDEGYLLFLLGYRDFPSNYGFSDFLYFLEKWHHNDIKTVSTADSQISSSRIRFKGFFFSILKRIGEILEGSRQQQHSHFIGAGSSELWGGTRPLGRS